jgi:hypothetical protein
MLDFDNIDGWAPKFIAALGQLVPESVAPKLRSHKPDLVEDARDLLFNWTGRDGAIEITLALIRSEEIAGYHGSRLTGAEADSIRSNGLRTLNREDRRCRLTRALSSHAKWPEVACHLEGVIQDGGRGGAAGRREGQVHLTLSRAGLLDEFLKGWSYRLAYPEFQSATLMVGCGMVFHSPLPSACIVDIDTLQEQEG